MTLSIRSITYQDKPQQTEAHYNLSIDKPEFVGLVGANGSGKSTLIKLLTGEYQSHSGSVEFNQVSLNKQPLLFKQMLGYMPDKFAVNTIFSAKQFLHYVAQCKQLKPNRVEIEQLLKDFHLEKLKNSKINKLSLGQQQKVNLAQALIGKPSLLLLDEPLNGLDPVEQQNFWQLLEQYKPSHVLMASHNLQELQQRSDRILIVHAHSIAANIHLQDTQFLIALNNGGRNINSSTANSRLLSCKTESEFQSLIANYSEHILCSGSTLDVLNKLFHLHATGVWQW